MQSSLVGGSKENVFNIINEIRFFSYNKNQEDHYILVNTDLLALLQFSILNKSRYFKLEDSDEKERLVYE